MTPRLRITVVLPGGLSFGAYEAGICSSLVEVIKASRGEIMADMIVGASAGAVTGLLTALALRHEDALPFLEQLWVERASPRWMLWPRPSMGPWSPLSTVALERWAKVVLTSSRGKAVQEDLVRLVVALAPLDGADVHGQDSTDDVEQDIPSPGWSYRDARRFLLGEDHADWLDALDAVLASSAHPLGFAPRQLTSPHAGGLLRDGTWFTDGGASDNLPLSLALDVLRTVPHDGAERLVLIVHHAHVRPAPLRTPTFLSTGLRALEMFWRGPSLAEVVRGRALPAPVMIVSPGDKEDEALEGAAWANVRGFFSKAIRQRDFARGQRDFLDRWLSSRWCVSTADPRQNHDTSDATADGSRAT